MRKFLFGLGFLAIFSNFLFAEDNAWFVGAGMGFTAATSKAKPSFSDTNSSNISVESFQNSSLLNLIGGYKYFFKADTGLRTYLEYQKHNLGYDLGINADFLWNFHTIDKEGLFFNKKLGLFAGASMARIKHLGASGFNLGLNGGIRLTHLQHSLEFGLKLPFTSISKKANVTYTPFNQTLKSTYSIKQNFSIFARYVYSFDIFK